MLFRSTIIPQNNYVRRVYTDGRGHPKPVPLSFQGDTIGHWEGNTLVMETVGLRDESEFIHALRSDKANRTVTIVERIQKTDANHMRVDTTLDSPVVFNKPLTYSANYNRTQFAVSEEICTQNNLAVDPKTGDQVFPSAPNNDHSVPPR